MNFHEVRFPASLSFGSVGGPERRTDIVTLANGFEERNTPWAHSRRRYDAGFGMRSLDDIETLISFFEARQGQMFGFRWKDWSDYKSGAATADVDKGDQVIRNLGETGFVAEEILGDAVDFQRALVDLALRVDIAVELTAAALTVNHFQRADFDDPVALCRFQSRGFRIQNNLSHQYSFVPVRPTGPGCCLEWRFSPVHRPARSPAHPNAP